MLIYSLYLKPARLSNSRLDLARLQDAGMHLPLLEPIGHSGLQVHPRAVVAAGVVHIPRQAESLLTYRLLKAKTPTKG
jgi:hypothetical protein